MTNKDADLHTLEQFFAQHPQYSDEDKAKITKAWEWLCTLTSDTDHPLRVASILADLQMDCDCIIAAILHGVLDGGKISGEQLEQLFGKTIYSIVESGFRIASLKVNNKTLQQADSFRKMLFAMIDDIRVILVKLADRLDCVRNLKGVDPEIQKSVSQEILDVWAPLANRLGMSSVKDELEDLSLKYTNPDVYEQIKHLVMLKKEGRADYLENAKAKIKEAAEKAGINITISSRAKHFYSIYQKMRKRGKAADEIYDLLALRLICDDTAQCYTLIGLVHTLWKPLDGRFKDYIAMPKSNGYQSLHTTVMCEGLPLEIQIRTKEMHTVAEHGVASHWLYKKGTNRDSVKLENLSIINQLRELRAEHGNDAELFAEIREELLGDSIFVFTPKGDVRELPAGSTAVDFAYYIHSHIGETIVGAKADGHIIPLSSPLKNTQIIEILTNPQAHPTRNQLEYVKTARARSRIKGWLLQNEPEFKPETPSSQNAAETPAVGNVSASNLQASSVTTAAAALDPGKNLQTSDEQPVRIRIGDTTNFMVRAARCCNPRYGDEIIGYVSSGRGLIIHKQGCSSFLRIHDVEKRSIPVVWEERPVEILPVKPSASKKRKRSDRH